MYVKDGMSAPDSFFRYLKVEKLLNPLCFTVSFSQRAASRNNSKIACFVKKLMLHVYTQIKLVTLQSTLRFPVSPEPKNWSSHSLIFVWGLYA